MYTSVRPASTPGADTAGIFMWKWNKSLRLTRRELSIVIILLAVFLLGAWLPPRLSVATSASLKHRVFFLVPKPAQMERGDYLVFRHQALLQAQHGLNPKTELMIKKAACLAREQLKRDEQGRFFCNETLLGQALPADSTGRSLPRFTFNGTIPAGKIFVSGEHPRSYDSKYFGFINAEDILHKALPLW